MKNLLILMLFILVKSHAASQEQKAFLEIFGNIKDKQGKKINQLTVRVLEKGIELNKLTFNKGIRLSFEKNRHYSVVIYTKDYAPTTLIIDTEVPERMNDMRFRFDFEYSIMENQDTLNSSISEKYNSFIQKNKLK